MLPAIPGITSGELIKFKISSLSDKDNKNSIIKTFEAMYNPNSFSQQLKLDTTVPSGPGNESDKRVFNKLAPQSYTFEFLLDGTGASSPTIPGGVGIALPGAEAFLKPPDVMEKVNEFKEVCYVIDRELHMPNYLLLSYGELDEVCLLESADIKYTLFKPDGAPLRARITATFNKVRPDTPKLRSADLTHIRSVSEGDNLPLMSNNLYESPQYYIQLAKVNRLKNFRRLRTGENLNFPPLRNVNE